MSQNWRRKTKWPHEGCGSCSGWRQYNTCTCMGLMVGNNSTAFLTAWQPSHQALRPSQAISSTLFETNSLTFSPVPTVAANPTMSPNGQITLVTSSNSAVSLDQTSSQPSTPLFEVKPTDLFRSPFTGDYLIVCNMLFVYSLSADLIGHRI